MMTSDSLLKTILHTTQTEEKETMPVMIKVETTGQRTVLVHIKMVSVEDGKIILRTNPIG